MVGSTYLLICEIQKPLLLSQVRLTHAMNINSVTATATTDQLGFHWFL